MACGVLDQESATSRMFQHFRIMSGGEMEQLLADNVDVSSVRSLVVGSHRIEARLWKPK